MAAAPEQSAGSKKNIWHHRGPVVFSALFDWPPRPLAALLALTKRWVTVTRNVLFISFAIIVHNYLTPPLATMETLSFDWILPIFFRNMFLLTIVAGGLHLYFYVYRGQGRQLKFDPREEMEKGKKFTFGNQVHDNIFWSLTSGVSVWTMYEVLYYWGGANGIIPMLDFASHPVAFFAWLLIMPVALSSHFYGIHRLLHWPPLFKRYHKLHHSNIHIGPWSGMSMHPVEHLFYISSVIIHYVIPTHPVIVLLHLYTRCLAPAFSHAGFEKLIVNDKAVTEAADFHHQLHHRFYECNYGNVDAPWDRWFGSLHDGTDEATVLIKERRRSMYNSR